MKFKPYPKYKDSGIEWLGSVPDKWEVKRLKYVAPAINEKVDASQSRYKFIGMEHIESWTGRRLNVEADSTSDGQCSSFKSGDVLFGKLRPYLAKALKVDEDGVCTGELLVLRPNEADQGFLFYQILNRDFITLVDGSTYGTKMPRASWEFIGSIYQPLPSLPEQHSIAAFLDRETGRIDELIRKKERQIELLQEKRQALISHAVTKGLDPNAKMKDSGIEWLGMVPEGWEVKRLKHVVHRIVDTEHKTAPFYPDGEYFVVRTSNIRNGQIVMNDAKYTDYEGYAAWTQRAVPQPGDIIFTREAPAGEACVVPESPKLCLGQRTVLLQINHDLVDERFVLSSIYAGLAHEFITTLSQGSTVTHFNMDDIGSIPLLVPYLSTQRVICAFLDNETGRIDELAAKIRASIETLREYRTALISAAVTGKIDVRGEV